MPDPTQVNLKQKCVVWPKTGHNTRYGMPEFGEPYEVRCRWSQVLDDQSQPTEDRTTESYPRSMPVGQHIPLGSKIWGPGTLKDVPEDAVYLEVVATREVPDLKGKHPARRVTLQKMSRRMHDE
jgi:hypothetical protein